MTTEPFRNAFGMLAVLMFWLVAVSTYGEQFQSSLPLLMWANAAGGGSTDSGWSAMFDSSANILVVGAVGSNANIGSVVLSNGFSENAFLAKFDTLGHVTWARLLGNGDSVAYSIALDRNNNLFVAGAFQGTYSVGLSNLNSLGGHDGFIAKLDANGNLQWIRQVGTIDNDYVNGAAVDNVGNCYVIGALGTNLIVTKFNGSGAVAWNKSFSGAGYVAGQSIAVDAAGYVFVDGMFTGVAQFGNVTLTSAGDIDGFVAKLSPIGDVLWTSRFGFTAADSAHQIAVSPAGNCYVAGGVRQSPPYIQGTVLKLDSTGVIQWMKQFSSPNFGQSESVGIALDAAENVYVAGSFNNTVDFGGTNVTALGGDDPFLLKYSAAGTLQWVERFGGSSEDGATALAVGGDGSVALLGSFYGTSMFGPITLTSAGDQDIFIANCGVTTPSVISATTNFVRAGITNVYLSGSTIILRASGAANATGFQWRLDSTNLSDTPNLSGTTSSNLQISLAQMTNSGAYSVLLYSGTNDQTSLPLNVRILDPSADDDGDGLSNQQEFKLRTNPLSADTDGDGLSDYDEVYVYGTDPLNPDTDGDGIPDGWEVAHNLNPLLNDANGDANFDGITNLQKYQNSLSQTTSPAIAYYYDPDNRLLGAEYSKGISIGYQYDGNGNLIDQVVLSRATEATNLIPVLWQFIHHLTNASTASAYADPDGDGWSNYQEWLAGTDPMDANSKPNVLFNPPGTIATCELPFTVDHFVMSVGQLDGIGAEEIAVGADGDVGLATNYVFLLTQGGAGWIPEKINVGSFSVTSIAIGQPNNCASTNIYVGLRQGATNGAILEIVRTNGNWQTNAVVSSTNSPAFVYAVRKGGDLLASFNPASPLMSVTKPNATGGWSIQTVSTNSADRGLAVESFIDSRIVRDGVARLLNSGGIQVIGGPLELSVGGFPIPTNSVYNPDTSKWYFETASSSSWLEALASCTNVHCNLVTIQNDGENSWIRTNFVDRPLWIGLYHTANGVEGWVSGLVGQYRNWETGYPCALPWYCGTIVYDYGAYLAPDYSASNQQYFGKWGAEVEQGLSPAGHFGLGEAVGAGSWYTNTWLLTEPALSSVVNSKVLSLISTGVRPQQPSRDSILYSFVDDKNNSGIADAGDDYVFVEYQIKDNSWTMSTLARMPISGTKLAQTFTLGSCPLVYGQSNYVFAGEPDGTVSCWRPTNSAGPLQRTVFSSALIGTEWHGLHELKLAEQGESLVGVNVNGTNANVCSVVQWMPQFALPTAPAVPNTAPSAIVMPSSTALGALAHVTIRIWDAEGNASSLFMQYQLTGSTNWHDASLSDVDGAGYNSSLRISALPSGISHSVVWNAFADFGTNAISSVLLRARAQDVTLMGNWSQPTQFEVDLSQDSNGNGIPDWWELKYFGNLSQSAAGDYDGDGVSNWAEYVADTDPTDKASFLRLSSVQRQLDGVHLAWMAGPASRQVVQFTTNLAQQDALWADLWTDSGVLSNQLFFIDTGATNVTRYYRVRAERP